LSGIYIHIPFCKQACNYCDFHFSTSLGTKDALVKSIEQELISRKDYLTDPIETIYFGGGTPSLLNQEEIESLLATVRSNYEITSSPEITLEANPDDLNLTKLKELKKSGINRLSIGIQSFREQDLTLMNRAHNSEEALSCVGDAQSLGFENITIDLIYGVPNLSDDAWEANLTKAIELNVPHISAYCLTIEEKTVFHKWQSEKTISLPTDEDALGQFKMMQRSLRKAGYDQYEISNFGKPGNYAVHNSNYWKQKHYLGAGPSAHSFNGTSRSWNIRNNPRYIKAINTGLTYFEKEILSIEDQFNEYLMTGLRTSFGISLVTLREFSCFNETSFLGIIEKWLDQKYVTTENSIYKLSDSGKFISDAITSDLFLDKI
jgi:oxygen-independent coproporphyrinogen-3 oxidase